MADIKIGVVDTAFSLFSNTSIEPKHRKGMIALLLEEPETFEHYFMGAGANSDNVVVNGNIYKNPQKLDDLEIGYCESRQKINAIKEVRGRTGLGLKESKDLVDDFCRLNNL